MVWVYSHNSQRCLFSRRMRRMHRGTEGRPGPHCHGQAVACVVLSVCELLRHAARGVHGKVRSSLKPFFFLLKFVEECTHLGNLTWILFFRRDGKPYCEKDYQKLFGIRCAYCQRFISGKVLQVCSSCLISP